MTEVPHELPCATCERLTPRDRLQVVFAKKDLGSVTFHNIYGKPEEVQFVDWAMVCSLQCARDVPADYKNSTGNMTEQEVDELLVHIGNKRKMLRTSAASLPETRATVD